MDLKENFLNVIQNNYANFNGRARRKEYWSFALACIILSIAASIVFGIIYSINNTLGYICYGILSLASLVLVIPGLALTVRRLHDTNKSGWFILISLIPFIGGLYLLYCYITEGDKGTNQYGPDPKSLENNNNDPFFSKQDPFEMN